LFKDGLKVVAQRLSNHFKRLSNLQDINIAKMKKTKITRSTLITAIVMLALGGLIGWLVKPSGGSSHDEHKTEGAETSTATIWTCSMDPQVRQPEPGKCPICGMDLIPLEEGMDNGSPAEIKMSPTAMQLANVQTMTVGFGKPVKDIRLNGKVQPDERLIFSQSTHIDGRVEQLAVSFTGEPVRQGQTLATVYSPELVTAQEELFSALKIKDMQPALYQAARQKLKNWKLTDRQIDDIVATGKPRDIFPILADVSGIVMAKKVNLGDYVMRGMPLYEIMDLSRVWVLFDVYENDMPWVKAGTLVSFTIQSLPGEKFTGKISFIDPVIDPMTRVAAARVEMSNPGRHLKPEMFATGIVKAALGGGKDNLIVPKSAVMWTGERSVVYIKNATDQGVGFAMREIELGTSLGDGYVVKEGLQAGEEIAVSGTFSIDAAAQLAGKPSMMNPGGGAVSMGHQPGATSIASLEPVSAGAPAKAALQKVFDSYFQLKDALVQDDFTGARTNTETLKNLVAKTDTKLFEGKAHDAWMQFSEPAAADLKKMAAAKSIAEERAHFKPFSERMVVLAKTFASAGETIYVQHCPMADNNKGADWLSREKKVLNPYFGDAMLTCGKVTEVIGQ
jgi:Cu(I)/Ag(I) efflux system membrane fusion protein